MKKGNGANPLFLAILLVGGLFLFHPDMADIGRTLPGPFADTTDTLVNDVRLEADTPDPMSVFVPDSIILVGVNVRPINCRFIFVRDSFDPETVRPVGRIFTIVNN